MAVKRFEPFTETHQLGMLCRLAQSRVLLTLHAQLVRVFCDVQTEQIPVLRETLQASPGLQDMHPALLLRSGG